MYFQTGHVIFVPEWPKGEFVSIWPHYVFWTKSLVYKRCITGILLFRNASESEDFSVPYQPSGRSSHTVRTPIYHCSIRPDDVPYCPNSKQTKHHPSGRHVSPSGPSTVSRRFYPTCIRPDVSVARLDASRYSNSLRFFPSSNNGKIDQPSG